MKKILTSTFLLSWFMSGAVSSASLNAVTITSLGYDKNYPDMLFIKTSVSASQQSRITCHTDGNWNFVLKLVTPFETKMYSAILAAQSSKQALTLIGSGNCDTFPSIESLNVVYSG